MLPKSGKEGGEAVGFASVIVRARRPGEGGHAFETPVVTGEAAQSSPGSCC